MWFRTLAQELDEKRSAMSRELSDLADRVTTRFLIELGVAGGGVLERSAGLTSVLGGSPIAYNSAVVVPRLDDENADAAIAAISARLDELHAPGSWHLDAGSTPADLADRLLAAGYVDGGADASMALPIDSRGSVPPLPEGADIHEVDTARDDGGATLQDWIDVLSDGFGEGRPEAEWAGEVYRRLAAGPSSHHRLLVATQGGAPVSAASLLIDEDAVGIFFVGTRPSARRKGLGAAITHCAIRLGAEAGCRAAVLGASPMGRPVYARLGFVDCGSTRILERAAPTS